MLYRQSHVVTLATPLALPKPIVILAIHSRYLVSLCQLLALSISQFVPDCYSTANNLTTNKE